jgi:hypothetical protein
MGKDYTWKIRRNDELYQIIGNRNIINLIRPKSFTIGFCIEKVKVVWTCI